MQCRNTIMHRYLLKLASSSVNCSLFADRRSRFYISARKHAIAGPLRYRTWWTLRCWVVDVPDLTPNSPSGELQQSRMLHNKTRKQSDWTNISKHSTSRTVVQSHKVNNATPSRVGWHEIKLWTKQKSLFATLLWLLYDVHQCIGLALLFLSLTQEAVYRHVPREERGLWKSGNIPGLSCDLLNDARDPRAGIKENHPLSTASWCHTFVKHYMPCLSIVYMHTYPYAYAACMWYIWGIPMIHWLMYPRSGHHANYRYISIIQQAGHSKCVWLVDNCIYKHEVHYSCIKFTRAPIFFELRRFRIMVVWLDKMRLCILNRRRIRVGMALRNIRGT